MSNQFLTIIIVTYNAEKYIENAIKSLIHNGFDQCQIIVIDGASNDNTLKIIKKYSFIFNTIISEKDGGIYDAMNKGLSYATGNFVYFLGADDEIIISYELLTKVLIDNSKIYYGKIIEKETNVIKGGEFSFLKLMNRNLYHQSMFYSAAVFKENSYDINYTLLADYILNLNLWASKKYDFQFINYEIAKYSIEGKSSRIIDLKFKEDSFKLIFKLFGFKGILAKLLNPLTNLLNYI